MSARIWQGVRARAATCEVGDVAEMFQAGTQIPPAAVRTFIVDCVSTYVSESTTSELKEPKEFDKSNKTIASWTAGGSYDMYCMQSNENSKHSHHDGHVPRRRDWWPPLRTSAGVDSEGSANAD